MGLQQNMEDFARDVCTRIDGATELLQNIAVRMRQPASRLPAHNFDGKVLLDPILSHYSAFEGNLLSPVTLPVEQKSQHSQLVWPCRSAL